MNGLEDSVRLKHERIAAFLESKFLEGSLRQAGPHAKERKRRRRQQRMPPQTTVSLEEPLQNQIGPIAEKHRVRVEPKRTPDRCTEFIGNLTVVSIPGQVRHTLEDLSLDLVGNVPGRFVLIEFDVGALLDEVIRCHRIEGRSRTGRRFACGKRSIGLVRTSRGNRRSVRR